MRPGSSVRARCLRSAGGRHSAITAGSATTPAMELPGWNAVDLDDSGWPTAAVFTPPHVLTAAQMVEPNRIGGDDQGRPGRRFRPGRLDHRHGEELHRMARESGCQPIAKGSTVKLEYSDQLERDKPAPEPPAGRAGEGRRPPALPPRSAAPAAGRGSGAAASPGGTPPRRCSRRAGRGPERCCGRGPSRGKGWAWRESDGSSQHLQPARRNRRQWHCGDVPLAVQLPRIPLRACHRSRHGAGRVGAPRGI